MESWIPVDKPPSETGVRSDETVLAWHEFQGVLPMKASMICSNRFITHWRRMPELGWTDRTDTLPTPADCDAYNCVLARHIHDGVRTVGIYTMEADEHLIQWVRTPEGPEKGTR